MRATERPDHRVLADALRARVLKEPGETAQALRQAAASAGAGGLAVPPYGALARQIGEAAHRTTDHAVADAVRTLGEKGTFELILAAAVGAGLFRWDRAIIVLHEATDAAS